MKVYPLVESRTISPGLVVHRVHIRSERHRVIHVGENIVLVNEKGYAYTVARDHDSFWRNYEVCDD